MFKQHQQKLIDLDQKKCGIFHSTGGGKTRTALGLAKGSTLIVCPKTQFLDGNWEREVVKMDIELDIDVLSKEKFKKIHKELPRYDTIIFDEAHTISGVQPDTRRRNKKEIPKASQIFEACDWYIQEHKPERVYLLTATPTRNPMSIWAMAKLLGYTWDYYRFRSRFYTPVKMNGYTRYMVNKSKEHKEHLGRCVRAIGHTGKLDDWFDVPAQTERYINCPLTAEQKKIIKTLHVDYPDPLVLLGKKHQVENGVLYKDEYSPLETFKNEKIKTIIDFTFEFDKIIVFAKYLNQIEEIKKALEAINIKVYVLTGSTKEREEVIKGADNCTRCVFIAQSSISSGYELPSFRCTIFASASYVHLDLEQARGRNLRMNKLEDAKNLYVYLTSGPIDQAVWKSLEHKQDFHSKIYINNNK
jgi:superfamily II DNA or RNA helicase